MSKLFLCTLIGLNKREINVLSILDKALEEKQQVLRINTIKNLTLLNRDVISQTLGNLEEDGVVRDITREVEGGPKILLTKLLNSTNIISNRYNIEKYVLVISPSYIYLYDGDVKKWKPEISSPALRLMPNYDKSLEALMRSKVEDFQEKSKGDLVMERRIDVNSLLDIFKKEYTGKYKTEYYITNYVKEISTMRTIMDMFLRDGFAMDQTEEFIRWSFREKQLNKGTILNVGLLKPLAREYMAQFQKKQSKYYEDEDGRRIAK